MSQWGLSKAQNYLRVEHYESEKKEEYRIKDCAPFFFMLSNPQFERDQKANGSLFKFFNFFANTRLSLRWRRIQILFFESPWPPPHSSRRHIQRDRGMLVRQDTNPAVEEMIRVF